MINENKQFIREYFKAIDGSPKPFEKLSKYIAESDMELMNHIIAFERSFPNYGFVEQDMVAEGDKVAVRFLITGKGEEDFFGTKTKGKEISIQCFIIYQVHMRKIIKHWFLSDNMGMMQQLGALPLDEKQDSEMTQMNVIISPR